MRYDLHYSSCLEDNFSPFSSTTRNRSLKSLSFLVRSTTASGRDGACAQIQHWFCIMISYAFLDISSADVLGSSSDTMNLMYNPNAVHISTAFSSFCTRDWEDLSLPTHTDCRTADDSSGDVFTMTNFPDLIDLKSSSKVWNGSRQTTDQGTSVALAECTWILANEAILHNLAASAWLARDHNE